MKAKKSTATANRRPVRGEEPLPHELGAHLFALIRRRLQAGRQPAPRPLTQLTLAFE